MGGGGGWNCTSQETGSPGVTLGATANWSVQQKCSFQGPAPGFQLREPGKVADCPRPQQAPPRGSRTLPQRGKGKGPRGEPRCRQPCFPLLMTLYWGPGTPALGTQGTRPHGLCPKGAHAGDHRPLLSREPQGRVWGAEGPPWEGACVPGEHCWLRGQQGQSSSRPGLRQISLIYCCSQPSGVLSPG